MFNISGEDSECKTKEMSSIAQQNLSDAQGGTAMNKEPVEETHLFSKQCKQF